MATPIPPGYQLVIKSWENDLDARREITLNGLTEDDTRFLIHVLSHFKRQDYNNLNAKRPFDLIGNRWNRVSAIAAMVADAIINHPNITYPLRELWKPLDNTEDHEDQYVELLSDLLGYPDNEGYRGGEGVRGADNRTRFVRVFHDFAVHLVPQPIEDVTHKFK
jgi:hypothetical protein